MRSDIFFTGLSPPGEWLLPRPASNGRHPIRGLPGHEGGAQLSAGRRVGRAGSRGGARGSGGGEDGSSAGGIFSAAAAGGSPQDGQYGDAPLMLLIFSSSASCPIIPSLLSYYCLLIFSSPRTSTFLSPPRLHRWRSESTFLRLLYLYATISLVLKERLPSFGTFKDKSFSWVVFF